MSIQESVSYIMFIKQMFTTVVGSVLVAYILSYFGLQKKNSWLVSISWFTCLSLICIYLFKLSILPSSVSLGLILISIITPFVPICAKNRSIIMYGSHIIGAVYSINIYGNYHSLTNLSIILLNAIVYGIIIGGYDNMNHHYNTFTKLNIGFLPMITIVIENLFLKTRLLPEVYGGILLYLSAIGFLLVSVCCNHRYLHYSHVLLLLLNMSSHMYNNSSPLCVFLLVSHIYLFVDQYVISSWIESMSSENRLINRMYNYLFICKPFANYFINFVSFAGCAAYLYIRSC